MTTSGSTDVVTLSDQARQVVLDALHQEANSESLALFIEVTGASAAGYSYDLYFSEFINAPEGASRQSDDSLTVVVPESSVDRLRGSRLEFSSDGGGGLVLVNPNVPSPAEANPGVPSEILELGIDGPLGVVAAKVLDEQVNPSIASHGGRADLVAMDEGSKTAYVKLSGGCQGCAMSRMTLSQGIETMLRDAIPELESVIDVTDHASGVNPFYANA